MRYPLIFSMVLLCSASAHAQFNDLFDDLKKRVEKEVTPRSAPAQKKNSPPANSADQVIDEVKTTAQQRATAPAAQKEEVSGAEVAKRFRQIWCKSVDNSVSSKNEFKGVRTGDLCLAPDDLIIAIETQLRQTKAPYTWMTEPKALTEGGTLVVENVIAKDKSFFRMALIIDPFKEKAYLGSFAGLLCAADPTNSLSAGNPLRKALDDRFGKPTLIYTEYDQIKAQVDELEKLAQENKKRALTVEEAKKARDMQTLLPNLKAMAAVADKNNVLELYWDMTEKSPKGLYGSTSVIGMKWPAIRDAGGCKIKIKDNEDYGFALSIFGRPELVGIEEGIQKKNKASADAKVQSAPAPNF